MEARFPIIAVWDFRKINRKLKPKNIQQKKFIYRLDYTVTGWFMILFTRKQIR